MAGMPKAFWKEGIKFSAFQAGARALYSSGGRCVDGQDVAARVPGLCWWILCAFWDGPGLGEPVLRAGCDRSRKHCCEGELSACGVSASVPCSVGCLGLGFAAVPPLLHLVPLSPCSASGGAAGGSSGRAGAAAGLSSDPLCLQALSPHLALRAAAGA